MLNQFFITNAPAFPLLWEQHHPGLVALSVAMAVLASVLALQMAALARRADAALTRQLARGSGALARAAPELGRWHGDGVGDCRHALHRHGGAAVYRCRQP